MPTILQALDDRQLFLPFFPPKKWRRWRVLLAALFGLPIVEEDLELYRTCTGRSVVPKVPAGEATLVVGRRGGKSRVLALIAVYLACFKNWRPYLAPGESGYIVVVAGDRKQARYIVNYMRELLKIPMLAKKVRSENRETIELKDNIIIEVATCSYRTIRGRTVIAALCDEAATWYSEETSANPDVEVLAALRPSMATIPGAMLLVASSPYARQGVVWDAYNRYFGKDDCDHLVWRAPTRIMHPSLKQSVIDREYERDPIRAKAEYGAQFRDSESAYISRELLEHCVDRGVQIRQHNPRYSYFAFGDAAQGVSGATPSRLPSLIARARTCIWTGSMNASRHFTPAWRWSISHGDFTGTSAPTSCATT